MTLKPLSLTISRSDDGWTMFESRGARKLKECAVVKVASKEQPWQCEKMKVDKSVKDEEKTNLKKKVKVI